MIEVIIIVHFTSVPAMILTGFEVFLDCNSSTFYSLSKHTSRDFIQKEPKMIQTIHLIGRQEKGFLLSTEKHLFLSSRKT